MEIKACPFCRSDSKLRISGPVLSDERYVVCDNCDAYGPSGESKEDAIKLWNAAPRKEDDHMGGSCLNCKFYPCSNKTPGTFWCSNWEEKEDTKMEKNCRSCKYLKLGTKIKNKWYCTKALEDEYSSCKSWAPYNPFGDTHATACDNCQYGYRNDDKYYCGKAIGNLDYCCTDWEAKEPEPAPLNPENSSGKPFIDLAPDELDVIQTLETKVNEYQMAAEEAAELAQAMLKYCRVYGHGSWTPMNPKDAEDAVIEEYADLLLAMEASFPNCQGNARFYDNLERVYKEKAERWAERLKKQEE